MWVNGSVKIDNVTFLYLAKVYDEPSKFGIGKGRISELEFWIDGHLKYYAYDRGWVSAPDDEISQKAMNAILDLYK